MESNLTIISYQYLSPRGEAKETQLLIRKPLGPWVMEEETTAARLQGEEEGSYENDSLAENGDTGEEIEEGQQKVGSSCPIHETHPYSFISLHLATSFPLCSSHQRRSKLERKKRNRNE